MTKKSRTDKERRYLKRVKELNCGVCGASGPSDAHHPRFPVGAGQRSEDFLAIPLCKECHTGKNGIHGDRALWKVYRLDEPAVLAQTIGQLM